MVRRINAREEESLPLLFDGRGRTIAPAMQRSAIAGAGYAGNSWVHNGYQGAAASLDRSYITGIVGDSRQEFSSYTRTELLRKVRFFTKNIGMVRGVKKSLIDHAIGPGVFPIPATADDEWNELVWNWFWELAKIGDVTGRMTLWETQRMRTGAKFDDGEIFTINTASAAGWPQYQVIRAHNCGSFDLTREDGWVDGVKLDSINRPRAYRFRLRGDGRYQTVPARSVVHSYILEASDQVRGVTPLAAAINKLHDTMDALAAEMLCVKEQSRVARVITNESGEDEEPANHFSETGPDVGYSTDGVKLAEFFGGEIKHLARGEKLEQLEHKRPSQTFTGFIDYIGRDVTVGSGFPYEFAWDPSGIPGPAVRFVLEKVRVACDEWRRNETEDTYPYYTYAIARGMELGEIPRRNDWWKVEWLGGAEDVTIDRGRESKSAIENVKAALDNFKRYFARRGLWWKRELRQKAVEASFIRDLAKEFDVPEDRIHQMTANAGAVDSASGAPQN